MKGMIKAKAEGGCGERVLMAFGGKRKVNSLS